MEDFRSADPSGAAAREAALTPMMAQYWEIKGSHQGYLLFYRMGDFYELFFEDAEIAAAALGIVLTRRGKHLGADIPMCGVPIHAAQDYLSKLIGLGHRVAICEQVEDPAEAKRRGPKSVVRRDVVRLVTPGTLTEDELLPARGSNILAALAMLRQGGAEFAIAYGDVSTGETAVLESGADTLADELARIDPVELVLTEATAEALRADGLLPPQLEAVTTIASAALFDSEAAAERITSAFPGGRVDPTAFARVARSALGALIGYADASGRGRGVALRPPRADSGAAHMAIDSATRQSLELCATQRGTRAGSLLECIDCCLTAPGSRLLAQRLAAPLCDPRRIADRLDGVAALLEHAGLRERVRTRLKTAPDLSRALTRIALDRAGPRDLRTIASGIAAARDIAALLADMREAAPLAGLAEGLSAAPLELAARLDAGLADDLPVLVRDGGMVRAGFDADLDLERRLATESLTVVAALQTRLADETGLKSLKIRHNGVLGYFIELPASQGARLLEEPYRPGFVHRQTLASAMRFTTPELAELEGRIAKAEEAALALEARIFSELAAAILAETERLRQTADALAEADVAAGLAHLAATRLWCRPEIDASLAFAVDGGRHPVVEASVHARGGVFVANDVDLSAPEPRAGTGAGGCIWLVTGPNMGGKSTFLRQNALIAILAQMGSFVPATTARLGIVDRVFSRVGASDDIGGGRSTFMVEMVETAAILNRATRRSLVVLDEIGRGTATFDGLSIAWATVEALHETIGCRALFATHFHELTALAKTLGRVFNHTTKVREWEGDVVFLHELGAGAADRSYGIQVARLAGVPEPVLARARQILGVLEMRSSGNPAAVLDDLPLFSHRPQEARQQSDPVNGLLDATRPDELTPRQALELLYELKKLRDAARRN